MGTTAEGGVVVSMRFPGIWIQNLIKPRTTGLGQTCSYSPLPSPSETVGDPEVIVVLHVPQYAEK
jgi:hypothetical protein